MKAHQFGGSSQNCRRTIGHTYISVPLYKLDCFKRYKFKKPKLKEQNKGWVWKDEKKREGIKKGRKRMGEGGGGGGRET